MINYISSMEGHVFKKHHCGSFYLKPGYGGYFYSYYSYNWHCGIFYGFHAGPTKYLELFYYGIDPINNRWEK